MEQKEKYAVFRERSLNLVTVENMANVFKAKCGIPSLLFQHSVIRGRRRSEERRVGKECRL